MQRRLGVFRPSRLEFGRVQTIEAPLPGRDSGVSWPVAWRLRLPAAGLDLDVRALVDDQEQRVAVLYWEGAVEVFDRQAGETSGRGYLEMTGYTGR